MFKSKAALSVAALCILLISSLSPVATATVKATSPLTLAKLSKTNDKVELAHSSGFTLDLPNEYDLTIYEAKDSNGLRKMYVSSSQGPLVEISASVLDSLSFGPIDGISALFFKEDPSSAEDVAQVRVAGLIGLNFKLTGKATATSGSKTVKLFTLLTDYERAIIIIVYAQESSLVHAQELVNKLISTMHLDSSWKSISV
ncbi:MAG TPA: hypothetical protein PLI10_00320 [Bacillota bacterium]|nr:hypothetical protein [Bacillota bacterium]HOH10559.1 hypothetical protein [Bacillota bacterium]HOS49848.1 hypothetical protein [Bacillota bacterium]HOY88359.1 hypothetical protein [Bacillota bacterium]HPI02029.1 hypothetical protein [Bacillota bacterium]